VEDLLRPRLLAARLLRWWREREPDSRSIATPLDELVAALGLDVAAFASDLHPGTLGFLEPGEDLIFLRSGLGEAVRRFTLAHELGHAVLHRTSGNPAAIAGALAGPAPITATLDTCDTDDLEAPLDLSGLSDETLRPGQAYSARARRESEANAFAAALLLPADRVRAVYVGAALGVAASAPVALSARVLGERFGVSEDVAMRRLTALLTPGFELLEQLAESPGPEPASGGAQTPLDPDQRAAADTPSPALVVAGPGTGKTSTLVGRVAHLVRAEGVPAGQILALTFSNKAAREMRERLGHLLVVAPLPADPALLITAPAALPQIGTIHAFCGDLLRQYGPLVGLRADFRLVTQTEGYFLLRRLAADLELTYYQPLGAPALYFPDLLSAISRAKDELVGPERYAELAAAMVAAARTHEHDLAAARANEVAVVYTAYQQALAARGDPDFGDIIRLAVQLLQEHPDVLAEVRTRYTHVLVDEFQDINRAMGVLLRTLAGADGPLWAVGDPDQAIYRFRGASPANLDRFETEYPSAQVRRLGRNYRSYQPILEAAHAVAYQFIPGGERPELVAARAKPRSGRHVTLATAADEAAELSGLAAAIRARQARGRALLDQAILCRTRRGAQRVVAALHAARIPTRVVAPLLEQDDVKDLLAVLSLMSDGSGAGLLRAGALPDHAYAPEDARIVLDAAHERHTSPLALIAPAALAELEGLSERGRDGLVRLGQILSVLRAAPDVATALARYVFNLTSLGRGLLAGVADGDVVLCERGAHLARLLALAHAFEDQRRAAAPATEAATEAEEEGPARRRSGAAWSEFLDYVRVLLVLRQDAGGADDQLASADDGVWVLTVHASKGLEFPVVYLPGLAERRFPVQRQYAATPAPDGLIEHAHPAGEDAHLAEEACLFYVALTRARDELVLSVADRYGRVRAKPSRFLAPIEARLGKQLSRVRWPEAVSRSELASQVAPGEAIVDSKSALPALGQPERPRAEVISVAELEAFQRCPRQYAYQYVYGLRAQGGGLAALGRSVRETLRELREQLPASSAHEAQGAAPSLEDTHALFERHWLAAHGGAEGDALGPYAAVYRRYGRLMVQRAWRSLLDQRDRAAGMASADAEQEIERQVTVQIGGRSVSVPVDRIERGAESANGATDGGHGNGRRGPGADVPVRFVRHRLTRGAERPDLRALLYTLAAEEEARAGQTVEVVKEHLASGKSERIELSQRQRVSLREELEDALDGIESRNYPARPDPHVCQGCPFLLICPA